PIEIGDADFCPVSGDGEWRCPTLKALGLTVPPALLTSADEVHALMSTLWGKADLILRRRMFANDPKRI
ncbi:MAG: hypothetical protein WA665_16610, partial [Pseudolabrys sp.]